MKNCRGPEKLIQVKNAFPEHHLAVAYSDNKDDVELLQQAEQGFWVLGDGNIKPCWLPIKSLEIKVDKNKHQIAEKLPDHHKYKSPKHISPEKS